MDMKFTYYQPLNSDFLRIYTPIHKTDSFIFNDADNLKFIGGFCCFGVYTLKTNIN